MMVGAATAPDRPRPGQGTVAGKGAGGAAASAASISGLKDRASTGRAWSAFSTAGSWGEPGARHEHNGRNSSKRAMAALRAGGYAPPPGGREPGAPPRATSPPVGPGNPTRVAAPPPVPVPA